MAPQLLSCHLKLTGVITTLKRLYPYQNFRAVPTVFGNEHNQYVEVIKQMLLASLADAGSYEVRFSAVRSSINYLLLHDKVPVS